MRRGTPRWRGSVARPAKAFLVWGAGGHGRVVADLVRAAGHRVVGFIDGDPRKLGREVEHGGARVVLSEDELRASDGISGADAIVLGIGANAARLDCLAVLGDRVAEALAHPSAVISQTARLGRGTVVMPGAIVNAGAMLGDAVVVNSGSVVEHDCRLEAASHLSPGAVLAGNVRLGERAWVGAGATVIPDVLIGADAIVGAGAVVIRSVPAGSTVVGNPARLIHRERAELL
jgi:sugar O-acyltransferase (sialic acid O-acetyltransferase NeuD family)